MDGKRGGKGARATRTRPRSTISNKSPMLIVTFATWSSFVLINLKHMVEKLHRQTIDRFGFIREQLIRWRSREEANTSIACSAIDGGKGKKFDAGTRETCGPNIPETFKHTATPARANWSELVGPRPTLSLSCLQTHISGRETEI